MRKNGSTTWRPMLDSELAERARAAQDAIARDLAGLPPAPPDPTLAEGDAGLALFFAYWAGAQSAGAPARRAAEYLDRAIDLLPALPMDPSLFGGYTGVAWAVEHLQGAEPDGQEGEDTNEAVDPSLLEYLEAAPWEADYDLIRGLVGLGVYALERGRRGSGTAILGRVLDRLEETAERGPEGCRWWTRPGLLPKWQRERCPKGYYNLGVAHGIAGVVGLLAGMVAAGVTADRAGVLLTETVPWLLAQRLPPDGVGRFAAWLGPGAERTPSRAAWCYGDPGVAATLLLAARALGEGAWERAAIDLAHRAARRSPEEARISTPGLCHGAAGMAHMLNRMAQATGDEALAAASRRWFSHLLDLRRIEGGNGIGGFDTRAEGARPGERTGVAEPGLLTGAAGIGLALVAATSAHEPRWDRMLLLSAGGLP